MVNCDGVLALGHPLISCNGDTMWKRNDVRTDKRYVLQLCQDSKQHRHLALKDVSGTSTDSCAFRETEVVPSNLLLRGDVAQIGRVVRLDDGSAFVVDAHGVWFTKEEAQAMDDGIPLESIPWVTGAPPLLPPK